MRTSNSISWTNRNQHIKNVVLIIISISILNVFPGNSSGYFEINPNVSTGNPETVDIPFVKQDSKLDQCLNQENTQNEIFILELETKGLDNTHEHVLVELGVIIEEYLNSKELLVIVPLSSILELSEQQFVKKLVSFDKNQKFDSYLTELFHKYNSRDSGLINNIYQKYPVIITLFESGKKDNIVDEAIFELSNLDLLPEEVSQSKITLSAALPEIEQIAAMEDVKWLEYRHQYQVCNDEAAVIIDAPVLWNDLSYNGSGQIIGMFDSGLDIGEDNETMHKDFKGRIVSITNYYGSDPDDLNGHGTHVAGTILGNGSHSNGDLRGIAYNAKLVFQAGGDNSGSDSIYPPMNLKSVFQDAYDDGARIHSNSWGARVNGEYNSRSQDVDDFIWEHNNFTIVIAAGNGGSLPNSLDAPGSAKNAITVGATENYRPGKGSSADNIDDIYSFSGRGPTDDGRLKPDVMAPGTWILSTRLNKSLESIPSGNFWDEYDDYYAYAGGTSMATPVVSGAAAVLRQFFLEQENHEPSAALLKAAFINGAEDIGLPDIPNNNEGWGRINLSRSIIPGDDAIFRYIDNSSGLDDEENITYQFDVHNSSNPLRITLVWSDYKGSLVNDGEIINDLDLIVTNNETGVYLGNAFFGGWSQANTTTPDSVNNVECVYIKNPPVGRYNVTIKSAGIVNGPQNFALYLTGSLSNDTLLPPTGIKIASDPNGYALNLSWWPNIGDNITSYKLFRSNSTPDNFSLIAEIPQSAVPTYNDSNLKNNVPYFYKLKTITTTSYESDFSTIVKGIPDDIIPPKVVLVYPQKNSKLRNNVTLDYVVDMDTNWVEFHYYIDLNSDGIPNDGNSWIKIGRDNTPSDAFYWNTTASAHGPGDADSVVLRSAACDLEDNNYTINITGLVIDNTAPGSPVISPAAPNPRNEQEIQIRGGTEPNATVELFNNYNLINSYHTNSTGEFIFTFNLLEGYNNLTVRGTDEIGNGPGPLSQPYLVILDRAPPHVDHGGPYYTDIGRSFNLNSSLSHDNEKNDEYYYIANYTWTLTTDIITYFYGVTPLITINKFGEYSLKLIIEDAAGNTATGSTTIDIIDSVPPVADAGGNRTVNEDEWIFFNVFNCTDNDPWFFETAEFKWTVVNPQNETTISYGKNYSYIFYELGLYKIILTARDQYNNTDEDEIYINIIDITPPIAHSGGDRTVVEYHPVYLNASLSSDNDPLFASTGKFIWSFFDDGDKIILSGKVVGYTFVGIGIYNINLTVTDRSGNSGTDFFNIDVKSDIESPFVLQTYPRDLADEIPLNIEITTTFSEAIQGLSLNDRNFYLTDSDGEKVQGSLTYDPINFIIRLKPYKNLSSNQVYFGAVESTIEDLTGNHLTTDYNWYFSTVSPPIIMEMSPSPDSVNIKPNSKIMVVFNEPLTTSYINPSTLVLFDATGARVDGLVEYDNNTFSIHFKPVKSLNYSTRYQLKLNSEIYDLIGNRLEQNSSWYFTTSAPPEGSNQFYNAMVIVFSFTAILVIILFAFAVGFGKIKLRKDVDSSDQDDEDETRTPPPPPPKADFKKKRHSASDEDEYYDEEEQYSEDGVDLNDSEDYDSWPEEEHEEKYEEEEPEDDYEDEDTDKLDEDEDYTIDWQD